MKTGAPDDYPLNKKQITRLLNFAITYNSNEYIVSLIQVRLIQGIKGITYPRPIKGKTYQKLVELKELFVKVCGKKVEPRVVDRFYQIMTS